MMILYIFIILLNFSNEKKYNKQVNFYYDSFGQNNLTLGPGHAFLYPKVSLYGNSRAV
jgi:hypothetical protein